MGMVFGLGLDMSCGLEFSKYKKRVHGFDTPDIQGISGTHHERIGKVVF